ASIASLNVATVTSSLLMAVALFSPAPRCIGAYSNACRNNGEPTNWWSNPMRSLVCVLTLLVPSLARAGDGNGFVPLFNGKDLAGWEVREFRDGDKDKWSARDSILTAIDRKSVV